MQTLVTILESITTTEVAAILAGVVGYHLSTRLILRRWTGSLREQEKNVERVKARIAELEPFSSTTERTEQTLRIHEEEGISARPTLTFIGALIVQFTIAFVGMSLVMWHLDGPLSEVIWWVGPAYLGVRLVVTLTRSYFKKDEITLGHLAVAAVMGGFVMTGFAIVYAFLPVGTIVFVLLSSLFGAIAWKLAPPKANELPPIAMLFM